MFCPKCGSNNFEQNKFCEKCGAELIANHGAPPDAKPPVEVLYQSQFVSPEERTVAILGNSMAQTFLSTGDLSSSFAVLSDKRVYFHGKAFVRNGKRFSVRKEKRIVDVQDVTGTGFIYSNPVWLKYVSYVLSFVAFVGLIYSGISGGEIVEGDAAPIIFLCSFVLPIILSLIYCWKKRSLFEISFAGGGIAFNVRWFPAEESQNFQNALKQTSDAAKAQSARRSTPAPSGSVADEIEKLAQLLSQGLITQEEFLLQKRNLIGSRSKNNMQ